MSVMANDAAQVWMGIFPADEGQSSNSGLSPDMLFCQLLHGSIQRKNQSVQEGLLFDILGNVARKQLDDLGRKRK